MYGKQDVHNGSEPQKLISSLVLDKVDLTHVFKYFYFLFLLPVNWFVKLVFTLYTCTAPKILLCKYSYLNPTINYIL